MGGRTVGRPRRDARASSARLVVGVVGRWCEVPLHARQMPPLVDAVWASSGCPPSVSVAGNVYKHWSAACTNKGECDSQTGRCRGRREEARRHARSQSLREEDAGSASWRLLASREAGRLRAYRLGGGGPGRQRRQAQARTRSATATGGGGRVAPPTTPVSGCDGGLGGAGSATAAHTATWRSALAAAGGAPVHAAGRRSVLGGPTRPAASLPDKSRSAPARAPPPLCHPWRRGGVPLPARACARVRRSCRQTTVRGGSNPSPTRSRARGHPVATLAAARLPSPAFVGGRAGRWR